MIGLETNVLVRYLAQDEPKQAARATRLIEEELSVAEPVSSAWWCWWSCAGCSSGCKAPAQENCWRRWKTC
ncbi:PIN domain-containing protein [Polaromonas glacialis]|uniref:hypothetical protein n=1 Tax=Polaromonas glacialis TaxID=866564 RepID=UPI0018DB1254|nr:hypothetical protein [Polaromonas glacialis]